MGPATPSRLAVNEAFWSGTVCSAGYEWIKRAERARCDPAHPRLAEPFMTELFDYSPHTSRAHDRINNLFHLRRDHVTAVQYRTARTQAFQVWRSPALPLGHRRSCDRPSWALSRPQPIKLTVPARVANRLDNPGYPNLR